MRHLCSVTGVTPGLRLLGSAEKVDIRRCQQAERQVATSSKAARRARRVARAAEAESSVADYAAGSF